MDRSAYYLSGASFKDGAKNAPAALTQITDAFQALGQAKNNLGRSDLPMLTFAIEDAIVATTPEGDIHTGKLRWTGEIDRSIRDVVEEYAQGGDRTAVNEAAAWLRGYLQQQKGAAESAAIKREGRRVGHSESALKRARKKLSVTAESVGFPRCTFWLLPGTTLDLCSLADAGGVSEPVGRETKVDV